MSEPWHTDAELGWQLLSWKGEAQWFATKGEYTAPGGPPRADAAKKILGGRLRSPDSLIGTIKNAEALGWNLYLNANPTRHVPGKKKLSREDVVRWRYVVVDLDPVGDQLQPAQPGVSGPPEQPCRMGSADLLLFSAARIFSGRGYQYWLPIEEGIWFLNPPDFGRTEAERMMQGFLKALSLEAHIWAPGWKVDPACSDLARVVRCPGSVNQRTGMRAAVESMPGQAVPLANFAHFAKYIPDPPPPPAHVDSENLLGILPHLNVNAKRFILEGAEAGGRHRSCYATCKTLHELGVPPQRAFGWLLIGALKSDGESWNPEREVRKIMKQVYEKS